MSRTIKPMAIFNTTVYLALLRLASSSLECLDTAGVGVPGQEFSVLKGRTPVSYDIVTPGDWPITGPLITGPRRYIQLAVYELPAKFAEIFPRLNKEALKHSISAHQDDLSGKKSQFAVWGRWDETQVLVRNGAYALDIWGDGTPIPVNNNLVTVRVSRRLFGGISDQLRYRLQKLVRNAEWVESYKRS